MGWTRAGKAAAPGGAALGRAAPVLAVDRLDVFYGRAHALQAVSLSLDGGVLGIVGRNGMGKTTLCNALTGVLPPSATVRGDIRVLGESVRGWPAHRITRRGVAYVPQGRRMWPSLTVDETLRLVARHRRETDRVYTLFPRLAERRHHGGTQLSGGEQQMLAIGRALLLEPRLLVMDEPTEGLAPVIVEQVAQALRELGRGGEIAVLLIEQNLGVALAVADRIGVMVNGRIAQELPAAALAADRALQERLLGVKSAGDEADAEAANAASPDGDGGDGDGDGPVRVFTVRRAHGDGPPAFDATAAPGLHGFNRWNTAGAAPPVAAARAGGDAAVPDALVRLQAPPPAVAAAPRPALPGAGADVIALPVAATAQRAAYVAGTFDTKGPELLFLKGCLERLGMRVVTVDLSTTGKSSPAGVHAREVARHHPQGEAAVFTDDRGSAVAGMALAFEHFVRTRRDLGGLISAGGSGGTSLATPAMRALPIGVPKVMVSTMASGDTRPYVGPSDICMMYSVTDVQGINRISRRVLGNAAHALGGMIVRAREVDADADDARPALGLTMFGVTTPCVQAVVQRLQDSHDCLVFHATGVGGQSLEKLVESGLLHGAIDVSTTEIADEVCGGVLSAGATRLDVFAQHAVPYVGSCGALDMCNFGVWDSVPERYRQRRLYRHNPTVTLMRTTADECRAIGEFLARKLNAMQGPVRFLIPEGGVSAIDRPGQPFHDPDADRALFAAVEQHFRPGPDRRLLRLPHHLNDDAFADALVAAWRDVDRPAHPAARRA